MSDIFISYAREDRPWVQRLAEALQQCGWSVWWDRDIPAGKSFDRVIEEAIEAARCVLVVWSNQSVDSHWVRAEAAEGQERGTLIPVRKDDAEPPLAFRQIQSADLVGWNGDSAFPEFQKLVQDIRAQLHQVSSPVATVGATPAAAPAPPRRRHTVVIAGVVAAALAFALGASLVSRWRSPTTESEGGSSAIVPTVRERAEERAEHATSVPPVEEASLRTPKPAGGKPAGLGRVALSGVLAAGSPVLKRTMEWHVFERQADGIGERTELARHYGEDFTPELPAGKYWITVDIDAVRVERGFEVVGGRATEEQVVLNAGLAKLSAALTADGKPLNRTIEWHIYGGEANGVGDREELKQRYGETFDCFLPVGHYMVTATLDAARASTEIEVKAAAVTEARLVLNAGLVKVTGALEPGGAALNRTIEWQIFSGQADALNDRERITQRYSDALDYFLPAGRYLVTGKFEQITGQREVDVEPGKSQQVEVVLAK